MWVDSFVAIAEALKHSLTNKIKSFIILAYYAKACNELAGPTPRHFSRATQLLSKKYRSPGEPLATLCLVWPARDLNLRPPASETNTLLLENCNRREQGSSGLGTLSLYDIYKPPWPLATLVYLGLKKIIVISFERRHLVRDSSIDAPDLFR